MRRLALLLVALTVVTLGPGMSVPIAARDDPLDARLGGTRESFEAKYGEPLGNRADAGSLRYDVPGYGLVRVAYHKDHVRSVTLQPNRTPGRARTEPDAADWGASKAEELARRFLPADVQVVAGQRQNRGERVITPGRSDALTDAFAQATYDLYEAGGQQGDCRYVFQLAQDGKVAGITVTIGSVGRDEAALAASPTAAAEPAASPTAAPTSAPTAPDATADAACPATTGDENKALVERWYDDVVNGQRPQSLRELLAADVVIHPPDRSADEVGLGAAEDRLAVQLAAVPDLFVQIETLVGEGDLVAAYVIREGTPDGGEFTTTMGTELFRIACGRIAEWWPAGARTT